jgi:hypothetical protein
VRIRVEVINDHRAGIKDKEVVENFRDKAGWHRAWICAPDDFSFENQKSEFF